MLSMQSADVVNGQVLGLHIIVAAAASEQMIVKGVFTRLCSYVSRVKWA